MIAYVEINGTNIEFFQAGRGRPLLFLHGAFGSFRFYLPILRELAKTYTVYAPTLPGMGNSEDLGRAPRFSDYVQFVKRFIDDHAISEDLTVVGHSLGGGIAAMLLGDDSIRIEKAVLVNPGAHRIKKYRLRTILGWTDMVVKHLLHIRALRVNQIIPWDAVNILFRRPRECIRILRLLQTTDFGSAVFKNRNISECIIVSSTDDHYVTPDHAAQLHKKIKGSRFVKIEKGGHNWFIYKPRKLLELI